MKVLIIAVILLCGRWGSVAKAKDLDTDYKKLAVGWGETFYDVTVLGSDQYGLMFRHRKGIAKVDYDWLPLKVEKKYMPKNDVSSGGKSVGFHVASEPVQAAPIVLTVSNRVPVAYGVAYDTGYSGIACEGPYWRAHWSRFHPAHLLANPNWRAMAVRGFRHSSGLNHPP